MTPTMLNCFISSEHTVPPAVDIFFFNLDEKKGAYYRKRLTGLSTSQCAIKIYLLLYNIDMMNSYWTTSLCTKTDRPKTRALPSKRAQGRGVCTLVTRRWRDAAAPPRPTGLRSRRREKTSDGSVEFLIFLTRELTLPAAGRSISARGGTNCFALPLHRELLAGRQICFIYFSNHFANLYNWIEIYQK
jgi:hypothetical protein